MGYRFRLHVGNLPGKPDIVLPRHKKVVLVHGCFWHGHKGCKRAKMPTTNIEFWQTKIAGNFERDIKNNNALVSNGWRVLVVWSCEITKLDALRQKLKGFMNATPN